MMEIPKNEKKNRRKGGSVKSTKGQSKKNQPRSDSKKNEIFLQTSTTRTIPPLNYMNAVIIVNDLEKSKYFYNQILNLPIVSDFGPNVAFDGGIAIWEKVHASQILNIKEKQFPISTDDGIQPIEFYFETENLEFWLDQMEQHHVPFVHPLITQPWQQQVFRVKDPDCNIIEFGEPLPVVVHRLAAQGLNPEEIAAKTSIPEPGVKAMLAFSPQNTNQPSSKSTAANSILEFYRTFGRNTDPGDERGQLSDLPNAPEGIPTICETIQKNFNHFFVVGLFGKDLYNYTLADARNTGREPMDELSIESIQELLAKQRILIGETNVEHIKFKPRPIEKRQFTICRTYAAIITSILRSQGISARVRCGFAKYLNPGLLEDHYVCEYYHPTEQRWILVDAQLDQEMIKFMHIAFDPCDVPREMFIVAGEAWRQFKMKKIDPSKCGIMNIRGADFIRANVQIDFANLNKEEVQPWAVWGLKQKNDLELTESEWKLVDDMALLTHGDIGLEEFSKIRSLYEKEKIIKVPEDFKSPHFNTTGVTL